MNCNAIDFDNFISKVLRRHWFSLKSVGSNLLEESVRVQGVEMVKIAP